MFTGIIEEKAVIKDIQTNGSNKTFSLYASLAHEFKIDQSISHNGVCLTVEQINGNLYTVTAIAETLAKTNLSEWQINEEVNIERSLIMNGRLDGHIVQGHVDTTATCVIRKELAGSWEYRFSFSSSFAALVIEKGSICLNGISLTIFDVAENEFSVAVIPYTYHHTNISSVEEGSIVNIEFDMIGKYAQRFFLINKSL